MLIILWFVLFRLGGRNLVTVSKLVRITSVSNVNVSTVSIVTLVNCAVIYVE